MKMTCNSGASLDDADLKDDTLIIECKVRSAMQGVTIPRKLIDKVSNQALKWRRDWAIVTRNAYKEDHITLPLNVFQEIYDGYNRTITE